MEVGNSFFYFDFLTKQTFHSDSVRYFLTRTILAQTFCSMLGVGALAREWSRTGLCDDGCCFFKQIIIQ